MEHQLLSDIVDLLLLCALLTAIAWLTGRILGVHRGFWRALVAGLIGYGAGLGYVSSQFGDLDQLDSLDDAAALGGGFIGYVLLVTMLASIALEALLHPRRRRRRGLPHPMRWVRRKWDLAHRLRQIAAAGRRHGLVGRRFASRSALASPEGARALRLALEECGGMFIKFGQIASGRDDLLPITVTGELGQLRTAVKPLPIDVVRQILTSELGPRFDAEFEWLDEQPLAAASVGVTHRARLRTGQDVIVKVQRPGVDEIVDRDGRVLLWGARQLERGSAQARDLGIVDLCRELVASVTQELDFTTEAANDLAMCRNRRGDRGVSYPPAFAELSTRRVLVMAEVKGRPVSDAAAVDSSGVARKELADRLLKSFLDQTLHDGVYHADPHPGNILIDAEGQLWFIDFGAVGHLDPVTLEALQQLAVGFTVRDAGLLARAVRRMVGSAGDDLDLPSLEFDMGEVLTMVDGQGFGPAAIANVVHVLRRHRIKVPQSLTVLGRASITMEGTLREISAGYRMAENTQQIVADDQGIGSARELLRKEILRVMPALRPMPQIAEDVALQLRSGRLTIRAERFQGEDRAVVAEWLDRVLWVVIGVGGLAGSALLLIGAQLNPEAAGADYLRLIGYGGLVASSAMQMRTVARVLQRADPEEVG